MSEGPDAERVIRQLAATGNDIVFTTSFGFMNPTVKRRAAVPGREVRARHRLYDHNLAVYNARFYEGRTVIGTIAGR